VAKTDVDEARRQLLAYVVDHYMKLTEQEAAELQGLTNTSEATEVKRMILSFHTRVHEQALQEGLSQGLSTGRAHGEQAVLLRQMRRRFGPLDPQVVARIEAIQDTDQLEALADRILDARTLEDLGLPSAAGPAACP
jgi:flagellar biosynthesis/type III secretory pathway protein FliH